KITVFLPLKAIKPISEGPKRIPFPNNNSSLATSLPISLFI
uniref:NADH-plastoquinone oxidoreductase subunit 5 n=1 Tax=Meloidogyne hapla TaxID=6305 RepID=A0A1I8B566_MELHA